MKIDIDTIFYIVLSIIILVVSGLSSRRRKQAQQMKKPASPAGQSVRQGPEEMELSMSSRPVADTFERLEQILTGQSRYETMEGESLEVLEDEEQMIIDEEEKILSMPVSEPEPEQNDLTAVNEDEKAHVVVEGLFMDINEITRAVIYSEILPRKYH